MKERPILFSAPMVRALLAGTKTQTRRAMRNQVVAPGIVQMARPGHCEIINEHGVRIPGFSCPYGHPGDRLWVRETWAAPHSDDARPPRSIHCDWTQIHYAATEERGGLMWRPSIHMPRWASRITLEITGVRVERLQDISEADAVAEGCPPQRENDEDSRHQYTARWAYEVLWDRINGRSSWGANPWVWVVEFKRVEGVAS